MERYTVHFEGVKTYWDFHEKLKVGLDLPDYYGKNSAALWDCLTGWVDAPCLITITGLGELPKELHRTRDLMLGCLDDAVKWYADLHCEFRYVIES